jgi:hypothetical protein
MALMYELNVIALFAGQRLVTWLVGQTSSRWQSTAHDHQLTELNEVYITDSWVAERDIIRSVA